MRTLLYWLVCIFVAVLASRAAERGDGFETFSTGPVQLLLTVQDEGRSVLLGIGVLAMAYTYRKAWLGWRRHA